MYQQLKKGDLLATRIIKNFSLNVKNIVQMYTKKLLLWLLHIQQLEQPFMRILGNVFIFQTPE